MKRLEMLKQAQEIAYEQIDASSCLPDKQFEKLSKLSEDEALYALAHELLKNATFNIEDTLNEIKEESKT